ncbi:MAG: putative rane protein contains DoxX family domain [Rhizobium sp.]|nr:putative rane protein contains DoxX family domain [Rhizobium sp.]
MNSILLLLARILLSAAFIMAGAMKFMSPGDTAGMIAQAGLPSATALTYLAATFEVVAGLAVLVGFQTRIASYLLALFCVFTALVFHSGAISVPGFPPEANAMLSMFNQGMMMKNLMIAGGFLALAVAGAGAYSVDGRRGAQLANA